MCARSRGINHPSAHFSGKLKTKKRERDPPINIASKFMQYLLSTHPHPARPTGKKKQRFVSLYFGDLAIARAGHKSWNHYVSIRSLLAVALYLMGIFRRIIHGGDSGRWTDFLRTFLCHDIHVNPLLITNSDYFPSTQ